jgi:transposase-like protein
LISVKGGSGKTIVGFCRDRGFAASQFYTWRSRLRKSTAEQFLEEQVVKARGRFR